MTKGQRPPWKTEKKKDIFSMEKEILRLLTCGSVDDGKSTLIGRLLYDSKSILEDQLDSITSQETGEVNLANLTDGLRAEREQGITIDVAYRYFSTRKRNFIIADTPGHIQYTRNMVTGASTANLALVMIDARHGVIEQTRRHAFISSLLRIPHLLVCINKMDLVNFSEEVFDSIKFEFSSFISHIWAKDINFIPISALNGDNVVEKSESMEWYQGNTVLSYLENLHIGNDYNLREARFPVQYVNRPQTAEEPDFRGFSGKIAGGSFKVGDEIVVLPSKKYSKIKAIHTYDGYIKEAFCPMSATLLLEDEIDISRGDLISKTDKLPRCDQNLRANVCWMNEEEMLLKRKYLLKCGTKLVKCMPTEIEAVINTETLEEDKTRNSLKLNDIARIRIKTTSSLVYDIYKKNRETGGFILIDESNNNTVAAGMLIDNTNTSATFSDFTDYAI